MDYVSQKAICAQVVVMGQSDVQASWCSEQDVPENLILEFNQQVESNTELISVNYSGQRAFTAVVAPTPVSDLTPIPPAKKTCTHLITLATEGYGQFTLKGNGY